MPDLSISEIRRTQVVPRRTDLLMRRNDNPWRVKFDVRSETGALMSFTDHLVKMQVRRYPGAAGDPLIDLISTATTGSRVVLPSTGFVLLVSKATIASVPDFGKQFYHYDILVQPPSDDENVWFEGPLEIRAGVTA